MVYLVLLRSFASAHTVTIRSLHLIPHSTFVCCNGCPLHTSSAAICCVVLTSQNCVTLLANPAIIPPAYLHETSLPSFVSHKPLSTVPCQWTLSGVHSMIPPIAQIHLNCHPWDEPDYPSRFLAPYNPPANPQPFARVSWATPFFQPWASPNRLCGPMARSPHASPIPQFGPLGLLMAKLAFLANSQLGLISATISNLANALTGRARTPHVSATTLLGSPRSPCYIHDKVGYMASRTIMATSPQWVPASGTTPPRIIPISQPGVHRLHSSNLPRPKFLCQTTFVGLLPRAPLGTHFHIYINYPHMGKQ